jgi:hypothetical protein
MVVINAGVNILKKALKRIKHLLPPDLPIDEVPEYLEGLELDPEYVADYYIVRDFMLCDMCGEIFKKCDCFDN